MVLTIQGGIVAGAVAWHQRGEVGSCDEIESATAAWREQEDIGIDENQRKFSPSACALLRCTLRRSVNSLGASASG